MLFLERARRLPFALATTLLGEDDREIVDAITKMCNAERTLKSVVRVYFHSELRALLGGLRLHKLSFSTPFRRLQSR